MNKGTCYVDGCDRTARSKTETICAMHYHRLYRHGRLDADYRKVSTSTPRLYRTVPAKGHPTAMKSGRAYEHRKVLFDTIGPGVHSCHWCKSDIEWFLVKGDKRNLIVDHLNGNKGDNRPENLVPTCHPCNAGRALQEKHKIITEQYGAWAVNDTIAALRKEEMRRRPPIAA